MIPVDSRTVLGVFAKWPQPGSVKTRLAAATTPTFAADVARAFLLDTLTRHDRFGARRVLVGSPDDAPFGTIGEVGWQSVGQGTGDLGERMARFFEDRFREGSTRVVLIGTDSPTLPPEFVERAFAALAEVELVLGPATDGGYYLVGGTPKMPAIFEGIEWSSATVLCRTLDRVDGARLSLLPPWYDVDTLDDWRMLEGHIRSMRCAGIDPMVPHTERLTMLESHL